MIKLLHIINPVKVKESSDLFIAQPVTFESMRIAKSFSEAIDSELKVTLVATSFEEDVEIIPSYFAFAGLLTRSILDFGEFEHGKKLPLLVDILMAAYHFQSEPDFIIYSNSDIAVMPSFYASIAQKLRTGNDALIINRRTISNRYRDITELPMMYSEIGVPHPGYDCFIMKRALLPEIKLANLVIGAPKVGLGLYLNLRSFSGKFEELGDTHLTFHIGDDRIWKSSAREEYTSFNSAEFVKVFDSLVGMSFPVDQYRTEAFGRSKKLSGFNKWKSVVSSILKIK